MQSMTVYMMIMKCFTLLACRQHIPSVAVLFPVQNCSSSVRGHSPKQRFSYISLSCHIEIC